MTHKLQRRNTLQRAGGQCREIYSQRGGYYRKIYSQGAVQGNILARSNALKHTCTGAVQSNIHVRGCTGKYTREEQCRETYTQRGYYRDTYSQRGYYVCIIFAAILIRTRRQSKNKYTNNCLTIKK